MTSLELTKAVRAIWKHAVAETKALIKAQKYKVFDSKYSFHRYVKHGEKDGIVEDGADLLRLFLQDKINNKDSFIIGTPDNIAAEYKKCLKEKIKWCRSQLEYGKDCIIKNEIELRNLLKGKKYEDDRQRKIKAMPRIYRKNRKTRKISKI